MQKPTRNESYPHEEFTLHRTSEIPSTTHDTVYSKGVEYPVRRLKTPWTKEETTTLMILYPKGEKEKLIAELENRTWEGIKQRAHKLGLKFPRTKCRLSKVEMEKLYKQMGARRAARYLGVDRSTVYNWVRKNGISLHKKINSLSLCPSTNLLHVLGVLKGDGFTRIGKGKRCFYLVGLGTVSEEFARSFANAVRNIGLHPQFYTHDPPSGHSKKHRSYSVKAASKKFVEWYRNLSNEDIRKMVGKNKGLAAAFVRGFYESEGTFYLRGGRYSIVKIGNTNPQLLIMVRESISSLGISLNFGLSGKTNKGKQYWYLHECGKDVLDLVNLVKTCIKPKPSNLDRLKESQQEVLFSAVD